MTTTDATTDTSAREDKPHTAQPYVPIAQSVPLWILTRPVAPHMKRSPRETRK